MSVLIYVETENGAPKKSSIEAVAYGAAVGKHLGKETVAVVTDKDAANLADLGKYGADKVLQVKSAHTESDVLAEVLVQAAKQINAEVIVLAKSTLVDAAAPIISVRLEAAVGSNVVALPDFSKGFSVRKSVYTGKALADMVLDRPVKVITLKKNAIIAEETAGKQASVETFEPTVAASKVTVKEVQKQTGDILLPEADIVVSAGRGMKGPENWGMVEDLAKALGAATACSKPVSDMDWRPHHEHVGQTGIKVSPNLYIALGISGAIQHLAGVNSSKVIVVINKDAEAPFFKAADYGIVGDVFEIIPRLTEALKKLA